MKNDDVVKQSNNLEDLEGAEKAWVGLLLILAFSGDDISERLTRGNDENEENTDTI